MFFSQTSLVLGSIQSHHFGINFIKMYAIHDTNQIVLLAPQPQCLCSGFYQNPLMGGFGNFFHWYLCNHKYNVCGVWNMLWRVPQANANATAMAITMTLMITMTKNNALGKLSVKHTQNAHTTDTLPVPKIYGSK